MNYFKQIFFSGFIVIAFSISGLSQGRVDGFYKGKGKIDLVLGGGYEFANQYYAGTNKIDLTRNTAHGSLFAAIGILDRFDINLAVPYVKVNNVQSIQDGAIYIKFKALEKEMWAGKLSTSIAVGASTNLANYQTEGLSAIGQQATTIDFRPLVHYFREDGWFGTVQFAYIYKFNPVPPAINPSIKVGRAMSKCYFDVWYEHQTSFGGRDYLGTPAPTTFRELGVGFDKIGGTFYVPFLGRFGSFVGASYVLNGRNLSKGLGLNAGIVFKSN